MQVVKYQELHSFNKEISSRSEPENLLISVIASDKAGKDTNNLSFAEGDLLLYIPEELMVEVFSEGWEKDAKAAKKTSDTRRAFAAKKAKELADEEADFITANT